MWDVFIQKETNWQKTGDFSSEASWVAFDVDFLLGILVVMTIFTYVSLSLTLSVYRRHHVTTANLSTWDHPWPQPATHMRAPLTRPNHWSPDLFKLVHFRDTPGPIQICSFVTHSSIGKRQAVGWSSTEWPSCLFLFLLLCALLTLKRQLLVGNV